MIVYNNTQSHPAISHRRRRRGGTYSTLHAAKQRVDIWTEFLIIGLKQQLSKIDNSSLNTTHSARNLGFIFDENLTFSDQISSLSKSCYSHIRELRCIRPYLDSKTASTIAACIVHSKLDYCNSLYYNLPKSDSELSCTYCG